MGLKVDLNTYRQKPDGKCQVRLYLYRNGMLGYLPIKNGNDYLYCDPKHFDDGRAKKTHPNANIINSIIAGAYNRLEQLMLYNPIASRDELVRLFEGKTQSNTTLFGFIDNFILECKDGKIKRDPKTTIRYGTSINHLKAFNPKLDFGDINKQFYDNFTNHCRHLKKDGKEYSLHENTIGGIIKHLKVFLNEANERGITTTQEHKKKYFKTIEVDTDAIYLNEKEINKILKLDIKKYPHLQSEWDRFIVSYYLLFRWSDSVRIEKSMLFKIGKREFIRKRWQKAPFREVVVPIKPIVKKILERNDYKLNGDSAQEANWKIKEICKHAKINDVIYLNGRSLPKYEFVASHCARRSFATNLYLQGVDIRKISQLLGHSTITQTETYLKVSQLENAGTMAEHPAFR